MRTPFVAGNWKMNSDVATASSLASAIANSWGRRSDVDVLLCPPFPYLSTVRPLLAGSRVALGAQNCYCEPRGAFTGEVSPQMLQDVGCQWVLVGHSERRHLFGETNQLLQKLLAAQASDLQVIYCVGETLAERQNHQTEGVVSEQLVDGLPELTPDNWARLIIAYEPVWAIGTGVNATPDQAETVHRFIRNWLETKAGKDVCGRTRILYGGSVNPGNAAQLAAQTDVDGFLVGGASLKADDFNAIVSAASGRPAQSRS